MSEKLQQRQIIEIAEAVFNTDIGPEDDIFSLGVDSVMAVEFANRLEDVLKGPIDLFDLWDADTVHEFAARLVEKAA
jgi:acyl carrier protein